MAIGFSTAQNQKQNLFGFNLQQPDTPIPWFHFHHNDKHIVYFFSYGLVPYAVFLVTYDIAQFQFHDSMHSTHTMHADYSYLVQITMISMEPKYWYHDIWV
jgi:hypothetical protein